MSSPRKEALSYLYNKALADKSKAEFSLDILLNNAVGIGDHSTEDYWKNLDEALDMLVDAEDRLGVLEDTFNMNGTANAGRPPF